jgi:WD domain, G-beta repeat
MQFSPDSRLLAWNGQGDSMVRLIEVASGQERHHFTGHRGPIWAIAFSADGHRLLTGSYDTTALVWSVRDKRNNVSETLTAASLDRHWSILADPDAATAYQSIRRLAASPEQTIPYLKSHLPPVEAADQKRFARLLADLVSNQFNVREEAATELDRLGEVALSAVRKALAEQPSAEMRRRLEAFQEKRAQTVKSPSPEQLRAMRALEILESIGTPEARQVLDVLAKGASGALITE